MLIHHELINECIKCCKDQDKNTRKFACFAVGNAGFHNEKLYDHLRPVVPLLVDLLKDPEVIEKKQQISKNLNPLSYYKYKINIFFFF